MRLYAWYTWLWWSNSQTKMLYHYFYVLYQTLIFHRLCFVSMHGSPRSPNRGWTFLIHVTMTSKRILLNMPRLLLELYVSSWAKCKDYFLITCSNYKKLSFFHGFLDNKIIICHYDLLNLTILMILELDYLKIYQLVISWFSIVPYFTY